MAKGIINIVEDNRGGLHLEGRGEHFLVDLILDGKKYLVHSGVDKYTNINDDWDGFKVNIAYKLVNQNATHGIANVIKNPEILDRLSLEYDKYTKLSDNEINQT